MLQPSWLIVAILVYVSWYTNHVISISLVRTLFGWDETISGWILFFHVFSNHSNTLLYKVSAQVSCSFLKWVVWYIYIHIHTSGFEPLIGCMNCKYLFKVCDSLFYSFKGIFEWTKLILMKSNLSIFFFYYQFFLKKYLPSPRSQRYPLMFSSRMLIVLVLTLKSMIHLK